MIAPLPRVIQRRPVTDRFPDAALERRTLSDSKLGRQVRSRTPENPTTPKVSAACGTCRQRRKNGRRATGLRLLLVDRFLDVSQERETLIAGVAQGQGLVQTEDFHDGHNLPVDRTGNELAAIGTAGTV